MESLAWHAKMQGWTQIEEEECQEKTSEVFTAQVRSERKSALSLPYHKDMDMRHVKGEPQVKFYAKQVSFFMGFDVLLAKRSYLWPCFVGGAGWVDIVAKTPQACFMGFCILFMKRVVGAATMRSLSLRAWEEQIIMSL